jgi:hypothetical protein
MIIVILTIAPTALQPEGGSPRLTMRLPSSLRHPPHFRPSGHTPSSDDADDRLDDHRHTVRQHIGAAKRLRDAKHGSTELAKRRSLPG